MAVLFQEGHQFGLAGRVRHGSTHQFFLKEPYFAVLFNFEEAFFMQSQYGINSDTCEALQRTILSDLLIGIQ